MKPDIPIPKRMREMQRDHRGYPVPYTVMRDRNGRAHFAVNLLERQLECLVKKRCTICGKKLEKTFWFAGGPLSAFHPHGAYSDTAMHRECMTYALQVCPYLTMPRYLGRVDAGTLDAETLADMALLIDPTMMPERPDVFVAVETGGFTIMMEHRVRPDRPYLEVEYWRHGVRIPAKEGSELAMDWLKRNPDPYGDVAVK